MDNQRLPELNNILETCTDEELLNILQRELDRRLEKRTQAIFKEILAIYNAGKKRGDK